MQLYNTFMAFNDTLKKLRLENDVTQTELSMELKIPQSTIAKMENGKLEANFATLIKIADYFDVSLDFLLGRIQYNDRNNNKPRKPRG